MELFGIVLLLPVSFIGTACYSFILRWFVVRWAWIAKFIFPLSIAILALLLLEVLGVIAVGAIDLGNRMGAIFYPIHIALFFLAVPALANVLQLQKKIPFFAKWYVTAFVCAILTLFIVLLQYGVSEALYGTDDTGSTLAYSSHL